MQSSARLLAIIQLCLAFSLILWYTAQPFMGEYFNVRSRMLLYEYVLGSSSLLKGSAEQEKLKRNAERFQKLPQDEKSRLLKEYQDLSEWASRPWTIKIMDGMKVLLIEIPAFQLAWLFFSVAVAILILLKVEGASQAAWLLPVIVLAYCIDNRWHGHSPSIAPDLKLFPTDQEIEQIYIKEPLKLDLREQKEQWVNAWQSYLVDQWVKDPSLLETQQERIETGEFNFNLARIKAFQGQLKPNWRVIFHEKAPYFYLALYLLWNVFFAWKIMPLRLRNLVLKRSACKAP